jgi:hypothetical protein
MNPIIYANEGKRCKNKTKGTGHIGLGCEQENMVIVQIQKCIHNARLLSLSKTLRDTLK